jgi:hypothetical protein
MDNERNAEAKYVSNEHVIRAEQLVFNGPALKGATIGFGIDQKMPMITITGPDGKDQVTWWRDGTCKIESPDYLDEAAKLFVNAVAGVMKSYGEVETGYVIRKGRTSEFVQLVNFGTPGYDMVQHYPDATRFVRRGDAELAKPMGDYQTVPVTQAMNFDYSGE